ncbi:MAG: hypothetical protein K0S65_1758, partial [Labilithrix sp.]|nr:hypothetical protein [Labilithrix sp.]
MPPPPPPMPRRSKQQCVAGLHVASQGACAWISDIFSSIFAMSLPQEQAGTPLLPLVDPEELELLLDDELELDVEPLLEDVEPASSFFPVFVGGGSEALVSCSSPAAPPP